MCGPSIENKRPYAAAVMEGPGGVVPLSRESQCVQDSGTGEGSLGNESHSRTDGDQFGEVLFVVGGDQDRRDRGAEPVAVKLLDEFKTVLLAEIDIDERHVWPKVLDTLQPFRRGRRHRHHADALMLEQPCRRIEEIDVVVDNDATRPLTSCHEFSLTQQRTDRMEASRKFAPSREGLAGLV